MPGVRPAETALLLFRAIFDLAGSARGTRQVAARYTPGRSRPGNDRGAAVNLRAVFPISVVRGAASPPGSRRPAGRSRAGPGHDRATAGRGRVNPGGWRGVTGRAGRSGSARVARGPGHPGKKGGSGMMSSRLMRWWHRVLLARSRPAGRAWLGQSVRPDLTAGAEPSVDAAGPGRQASATCPPAGYPAAAEAGGRSAPTATAPDPRWPQGRPRPPSGSTRPHAPGRGPAGVCPGRQAGRLPGRRAGSLDLPGHLPTLTGPEAQVSGGIYLRG